MRKGYRERRMNIVRCRRIFATTVVFVASLWSGAGLTQPPPIRTAYELEAFTQQYYLKPEPGAVSEAIEFVGSSGVFRKRSAIPPYFAWFAHVFAQHPERAADWVSVIARQDDITRDVLSRSMAASKDVRQLIAGEAPSAARNDMCWGAFFASGEAEYVVLLMSQLRFISERTDQALFFTAATAKWSLASNVRQHSRVRDIVEDALANTPPPWSEKLVLAWRRDLQDVLEKEPGQIKQAVMALLAEQRAKGVRMEPPQRTWPSLLSR